MVAIYIDPHTGDKLRVEQRAGRRSLERLGYTLYETDEEFDDVDSGLPPAPEPPTGVPNVSDVIERGDVSGTVDTGENPLGETKLEPDAEPQGAPAPWTAEAENVAAELQTTGDAELVDVGDDAQDAAEPKAEPEPEAKPRSRSPRRGKAAAADD